MIYGSVCSGIEAATVAWGHMGWRPAFFAETDPFPSAVLAHQYPGVPNLGDFTAIEDSDVEPIELLVGGTPCQDFSIAGLRAGMAGERGNLTLEFIRLAHRLRPEWLVWENVPGVLSSNEGRDFGTFLGGLAECGYGFAYRVLDAQHFGVPQRRRRVFVVGHLGDWRRAAAVLFERHGLQGHPPPRREPGSHVARCIDAGSGRRRGSGIQPNALAFGGNNTSGPIDVATAVNAHGGPCGRMDFASETFLCQPVADPLTASWHNSNGASAGNNAGMVNPVIYSTGIRRLTPRECERLQGFPDDYTAISHRGKPAADGPRYKAIGNSMAVPVMRWIGERIAAVEGMA